MLFAAVEDLTGSVVVGFGHALMRAVLDSIVFLLFLAALTSVKSVACSHGAVSF